MPYKYRFTTYQDARRVRLVDGCLIFETNILRVSPVKKCPRVTGMTMKTLIPGPSGHILNFILIVIVRTSGKYCREGVVLSSGISDKSGSVGAGGGGWFPKIRKFW